MLKVCQPLVGELEKKYLCQAIDEGELSGHGRFVQRFEEAFSKWSGNKYAIAVSSGTAALETAIWSLRINSISIPSGTIISCFVAADRAGSQVIFRDNLNGFSGLYGQRPVMRCHLFGAFDNYDGQIIVDDCSQYWRPFEVSNVACYSLYANKLITSGEGGVIITNDKLVYENCRQYRNLCHSKERFVHEQLGYNFRMSNLQAAVALAQLEQIDKFIEIKQKNRDLYLKYLPEEALAEFKVEVPWMYLVRTQADAGDVVEEMENDSIECRRFFYPLHRQPCINATGFYPRADELWNHTFYLPSGLTLTEKDIINVCQKLRTILRSL